MPRKKEQSQEPIREKFPTARTPEEKENQMISYAFDQAEQELREGRASSQIVLHFLKLGSTRERLEQDKLKEEVKLVQAKTESIESNERSEQAYIDAINAMKRYSGQGGYDDEEDSDLY